MALTAGDDTVATNTMARSFYDALNSAFGSVTGDSDALRRDMCAAFASAICSHIKSFGDVVITTGMSGLQEVSGNPTDAPPAPVTLTGAID